MQEESGYRYAAPLLTIPNRFVKRIVADGTTNVGEYVAAGGLH